MEYLQAKVMCPTSILVQLKEGCKDYFIKVKGRKASHTAKGNTAQQQSWMEPVTWTPDVDKRS